jgi:hypothetical protein
MMNSLGKPPIIPQAAAIPFRFDDEGNLWVLLTLRHGKTRWGIPKGLIDEGHTARETAALESLEEAGIAGRVSHAPVASFSYFKWGGRCTVAVYLLEVLNEYPSYMERHERDRRWFPLAEAVRLPTRSGIPEILRDLSAMIRHLKIRPECASCDSSSL